MFHADYIDAVTTALHTEGYDVTARQLQPQPMQARLVLTGHHPDLAAPLEQIVLDWQEYQGWRVTLHHPAEYGITPEVLHRGDDVAPAPHMVAGWLGLVLHQPDWVSDRHADLPLRAADDPLLDARLAAYARHTPTAT